VSAAAGGEARERAISKIRKLLAMANDGRGNEHEAANAARQAEHMMAEYQVSAADAIMVELEREDAFDQGAEDVYFGPRDPRYVPSSAASWVGVVAIGCGAAFTCKVDQARDPKSGYPVMRFSGYSLDVQLCRHVFQVLCATVYRLSVQNYRGKGAAAAKAFRSGAAGTLQRRLFELRRAAARERAGRQRHRAGAVRPQGRARGRDVRPADDAEGARHGARPGGVPPRARRGRQHRHQPVAAARRAARQEGPEVVRRARARRSGPAEGHSLITPKGATR